MMKFHKPGRLRMLGGATAIATLGGLSLAFGSAGAIAHPHPPAVPEAPAPSAAHSERDRHEDRVIVHTIRTGEHRDRRGGRARSERRGGDGERHEERRVHVVTTGDHDGHRIRTVDVHGHDGHPISTVVVPRDCERAGNRSEVNEGDANNRTRVIICTRGGGERSNAEHAEALQRTRARLAENNDIPGDQRQRVLAAIDREIARLRGQ